MTQTQNLRLNLCDCGGVPSVSIEDSGMENEWIYRVVCPICGRHTGSLIAGESDDSAREEYVAVIASWWNRHSIFEEAKHEES